MTTPTLMTAQTTEKPQSQGSGPRGLQAVETATTNTELPPETRTPNLRRLRALLTRTLYRRVAVQAAREEVAPNVVVVRALTRYLDEVEKHP